VLVLLGDVFLWDCALAIFVCCLAIHAMSVRILFAMGRDNNLPAGDKLASVSAPAACRWFRRCWSGHRNRHPGPQHRQPYAVTIVLGLGIIYMYLAYLGVTIRSSSGGARAGRVTSPPATRACSSWEAGRW
jgi:amino acid transporter